MAQLITTTTRILTVLAATLNVFFISASDTPALQAPPASVSAPAPALVQGPVFVAPAATEGDDPDDEVEAVEVTVDDPGIYGADGTMTATIEWAMVRFAEVGLPLPELRIYVHEDQSGCLGYPGVFDQDRSGTRVDLCSDGLGVVLHELAHAWEHHFVDEATRQTFQDWAGKPVWNDGSYEWGQRAIETAAMVVSVGLLPEPLTAAQASMMELQLEGFEIMTGFASPRLEG